VLHLLSSVERTGSQLAIETTTKTMTMPIKTTKAIMMVITMETVTAKHLQYEEHYTVQCCSSFLQQFIFYSHAVFAKIRIENEVSETLNIIGFKAFSWKF
jgi:hypothetical protein